MEIRELSTNFWYGSWSCSDESNVEYPTLEVYGNTKEEAAANLIKELELVILEAQDAIQELNNENN